MSSNSMASACDFEVNQTKTKGGCQSGRKLVTHNSKSDLPLAILLEHIFFNICIHFSMFLFFLLYFWTQRAEIDLKPLVLRKSLANGHITL